MRNVMLVYVFVWLLIVGLGIYEIVHFNQREAALNTEIQQEETTLLALSQTFRRLTEAQESVDTLKLDTVFPLLPQSSIYLRQWYMLAQATEITIQSVRISDEPEHDMLTALGLDLGTWGKTYTWQLELHGSREHIRSFIQRIEDGGEHYIVPNVKLSPVVVTGDDGAVTEIVTADVQVISFYRVQ